MQCSYKLLGLCAATTEGQGKVTFPVVTVAFDRGSTRHFTLACLLKKQFLEEINKQMVLPSVLNHKFSKNVYLGKISSVI
jgi:hypothetical protein